MLLLSVCIVRGIEYNFDKHPTSGLRYYMICVIFTSDIVLTLQLFRVLCSCFMLLLSVCIILHRFHIYCVLTVIEANSYGVRYDYGSVMHYGETVS